MCRESTIQYQTNLSLFSQQTSIQNNHATENINKANSNLVLESMSTNDVGTTNKEQGESGHDSTNQHPQQVMKQTAVRDKYGSILWTRFDNKKAFSYSTELSHPETSTSLPQFEHNQNASAVNQRRMSLGVNTHISKHETIQLRPSAAYSRHMIEEVKQNDYMSGKQGRHPVFGREWLAQSTGAHLPSSRNSSLLLASGTEDLWQSGRRLSSPGVQDQPESDSSSGRTTPVEGPSGTRSVLLFYIQNIYHLVRECKFVMRTWVQKASVCQNYLSVFVTVCSLKIIVIVCT